MRSILVGIIAAMLVAAPAAAHPGKHKGGKNWKETYYDGNCKVERKYNPGGYKEKVDCGPPARYVHPAPVVVAPAPVVVAPPGRVIVDIPIGR